jgi:hypothetical protein
MKGVHVLWRLSLYILMYDVKVVGFAHALFRHAVSWILCLAAMRRILSRA